MTYLASGELVYISEYFTIFRRRKWLMFLTGALVLTLAVAVATFWPATYSSSATILIEEADVPNDLVKSTVSAFAEERLQAIQQRVITTQNLLNIINRFNLYAVARQSQPISLIVDYMRTMISLDIVSANTTDPKNGRAIQAAIAFNLSFDGSDPKTTQQVTNELVTLYLSENQRSREEQATGTTGFLASESQRLQANVQKFEADLGKFKTEHAGYLPEDFPINTQLLDRAQTQLLDITHQLRTLRERRDLLQAQLSQTEARVQTKSVAGDVASPGAQLALLQAQYIEMTSRYGPEYPDVLALKHQIDAMKATGVTTSLDLGTVNLEVQKLQADFLAAKQKYGPTHPNVISLGRQLNAAKDRLASAMNQTSSSETAANPAYLQIQTQLTSVNSEIEATAAQEQALTTKSAQIEDRIFKAPEVERVYVGLKRDYDTAVAKYLEVKGKEDEAEVAKNLESERMGEKLSLIEPPLEPIAPIKPNRRLIVALGLFLACTGGIASGILYDVTDGRIHGMRRLTTLSGQMPFVIVPRIRTIADRRKKMLTVISTALLCCTIVALILTALQLYVSPLDVLWTSLLNRFGIFIGPSANQV